MCLSALRARSLRVIHHSHVCALSSTRRHRLASLGHAPTARTVFPHSSPRSSPLFSLLRPQAASFSSAPPPSPPPSSPSSSFSPASSPSFSPVPPATDALDSPAVPQKAADTSVSLRQQISNSKWSKLIKLELSALVCVTSGAGYVLTGGSLFDLTTLGSLVTGTMLCAAGAAAFNQIFEREYDQLMPRTRNRPLVTGTISLLEARCFAVGTSVAGTGLLFVSTTPTTALLGLGTIVLYANVYTPSKRITKFNTEIGAVVGALPPIMGWTAALGSAGMVHPEAFFLASTLFLWQMHHFMTIAWTRRHEYAHAGFVMQSLGDPTGKDTVSKGMAYALLMLPLPPLAWTMGWTNPMFVITGTATNIYLLSKYWRFYKERSNEASRGARIAGFWQLILLLGFMAFHMQDREDIQAFRQLDQLRADGLQRCMYHTHKLLTQRHWCVWLFGEREEAVGAEHVEEGQCHSCSFSLAN